MARPATTRPAGPAPAPMPPAALSAAEIAAAGFVRAKRAAISTDDIALSWAAVSAAPAGTELRWP
jgi:hypothetical protein